MIEGLLWIPHSLGFAMIQEVHPEKKQLHSLQIPHFWWISYWKKSLKSPQNQVLPQWLSDSTSRLKTLGRLVYRGLQVPILRAGKDSQHRRNKHGTHVWFVVPYLPFIIYDYAGIVGIHPFQFLSDLHIWNLYLPYAVYQRWLYMAIAH